MNVFAPIAFPGANGAACAPDGQVFLLGPDIHIERLCQWKL